MKYMGNFRNEKENFRNSDVKTTGQSYVYWTMRHFDRWVKRNQFDVTCFIITLFSAEHVLDVNTSILRSLRLIRRVTSWVVSGSMCVGVPLQCGYGGLVSVCRLKQCFSLHTDTTPPQPNHNVTPTHIEPDTTHEVTLRISHKLLRMDVLTSETCSALNKVIIKQVASRWSLFTQQQVTFRTNVTWKYLKNYGLLIADLNLVRVKLQYPNICNTGVYFKCSTCTLVYVYNSKKLVHIKPQALKSQTCP